MAIHWNRFIIKTNPDFTSKGKNQLRIVVFFIGVRVLMEVIYNRIMLNDGHRNRKIQFFFQRKLFCSEFYVIDYQTSTNIFIDPVNNLSIICNPVPASTIQK